MLSIFKTQNFIDKLKNFTIFTTLQWQIIYLWNWFNFNILKHWVVHFLTISGNIRNLDNMVRVKWLWCLTPFSTIFQLYCGGQVYWWRKLQYLEKSTDLLQVTDNMKYYIIRRWPTNSNVVLCLSVIQHSSTMIKQIYYSNNTYCNL